MNYKWGMKDLQADCKQLKEMIKNEQDGVKKFKLQECLDLLRYYIYINKEDVNNEHHSTKSAFLETMRCCVHSRRYYNLVANFYSDAHKYNASMQEISDELTELLDKNNDFAFLTGSKLSNRRALYLTDAFYKKFDQELYTFYQDAIRLRKNNLKFVQHEKAKNLATEKDGYTFFVDGLAKVYVSVDKNRTYKKLIDLIHEYGHVIAFLANPEYQCSNEIYFNELPSLFPELVALFNEDSPIDEPQRNFWLFLSLFTYYQHAGFLSLQPKMFKTFKSNDLKYNLKLLLKLFREYNIDYSKLKDCLTFSIFENGNYVASFEAALELIYIYYYENDKEKALQKFKTILLKSSGENEFNYIGNEIELGKHTTFMVGEIISKMKKSLDTMKNDENFSKSLHKRLKK